MKKQSTEEFKNKVKELTNNSYEILSEYNGNKTKVKVKHKKCGYIWETFPYNIFKLKNCPKCENKWKRDTETFKHEVKKMFGDEYVVLGEYIATNVPILMKHMKCGLEFKRIPRELKQKVLCPHCRRPYYKQDTKMFSERINIKYNGKYEIVSEYKSAREKILVKCKKCNKIWESTPDRLISNHGCPICSISRGEEKIKKWLDENSINYKQQYTNKKCKYKRLLRFDFAILDNKGELLFLIEYDGQQHFSPTRFSKKQLNTECESEYRKNIIKDKIKEKFCLENSIKLFRIKEKNLNKLDEILEDIFNGNTIPWETFLYYKEGPVTTIEST